MAKDIKRHISHLKSSGTTLPAAADLIYGEIAVGYGAGNEVLYIKNSSDNVIPFVNGASALAEAEAYADSGDVTSVTGDTEITVTLSDKAASGRTLTVKHASGSAQSGFKKLASDAYGHITGGSNVALSDLTGLGALSGVTGENGISASTPSNGSVKVGLASLTNAAGTYKQVVVDSYGRVTSGNTADNNTWRSIKVNGTNFLTDTSTALNLSGGSNVTLTTGSTGLITIAATNTTYTAATAAPNNVATASSVGTSAKYAREDHTHAITLATGDANGQVKIAGTNVSVKGLGGAAYLNTGTTAGTVAAGNHTHSNMVTGSSLTANNIIVGNGSSAIKDSGVAIETTLSSTLDTAIPTSKAVATYVTSQMASALTYKGAISSNDTLKPPYKTGDVWVVSSAGTYAGKVCEVGDYLIANKSVETGTSVVNADWDAINGENQVENKNASLAAAGSSVILATVDGTNITVTTPSTWTGVAKTGTVTKVSTGAGLVGGDITTTGTLKAALSSETKSTLEATAMGSTASRQYAVGLDKNGVLSVNIPWTNTNSGYVPTGRTITTASGLTGGGNLSANRTIGLEATGTSGTYGPTADVTGSNNTTIKVPQITTDAYGRVTSVTERTYTSVDHTYTVNNGTFAISGNGTSVASTSANASTNSGLNIKNGTFVSLTTGTSELTIGVSTGTSSSTLARGDHSHSSYANQNAYSNIKIGSTTLAAASTTDTVEFATTNTSGTDGLTISGTNGAAGADKVTINLGDIVCGDYA